MRLHAVDVDADGMRSLVRAWTYPCARRKSERNQCIEIDE
jgi:hypothetical protein